MITFKWGNEAKKFLSKVASLPDRLVKAKERAENRSAELYAERVRGALEQQTFDAPPLSEQWVRRKAREGLDGRTLIATKEYLDSIQAVGSSVEADAEKKDLAENGTKNQPPRPHWGPALDSIRLRDIGGIMADEFLPTIAGRK